MTKQPNILMIVTDQEYAHQPMPADFALPSRDRIRARGVTFNQHHCTTTVCTPSRSVMYTGRHTPHTRMFDNTNFAWIDDMKADPETLPTIGHMLRDLGYHTVYKGKWHLSEIPAEGSREAMEPYGFSEYQDFGDVIGGPMDGALKDPKIADEAVDWLATRAPEVVAANPWFMTVNFVNPHDVMFFDTDAEEMVQVKGMFPIFDAPDTPLYHQKWQTTLPASFFDDLEGQPPAVRDYKRLCDMYYGRIPMDRRDMWHNHVNYYLNCILDVDRHIGAVLDELEASGQADDTIVIFTSDHGEQGGAHHLRQKGSVAFQESVNVPLVIADPRHRREQVGCGRFPSRSGADDPGVCRPVGGRTTEALPAPERPRPLGRGPRSRLCRAPRQQCHTRQGEPDHLRHDRHHRRGMVRPQRDQGVRRRRRRRRTGVPSRMEAFKGLVNEIGVPNLEARELFRGIFDGRYKLVRYFGMGNYHLPTAVQQLLADNDVALYDLQSDPDEMDNLANPAHPRYDEALLSAMNQKLNALIAEEIGEDKAMFTPPETVSQA